MLIDLTSSGIAQASRLADVEWDFVVAVYPTNDINVAAYFLLLLTPRKMS
jgi:hypothetical protein